MKTIIIGAGEVGKALYEVLSPHHETLIRDIEPVKAEGIEVLQICYPDSPAFVEITKSYIAEYTPFLTIINSSVAVGTTDKCGDFVIYSPIRGRHPENGLSKELRSFPKFIACKDRLRLDFASNYFKKADWEVRTGDNPSAVEYFKLISNVHMGLEIAWRQEVERMLKKFNINPTHYEIWEETYTRGYESLGQWNLIRPNMNPGPIGGHCILPCTEILKSQFPSRAFDFILESNEKAKAGK